MTIYDVSKEAGVSIATVSRVLNGSDSVRPQTRQKVLDVIDKYGYTPNAFARGLGLDTMKIIGILIADCSDMFLAKAISFVEKYLRDAGYESILCCTGYDHDSKKAALERLVERRVDGIIMIGSSYVFENPEDNDYISANAENVPIMLLNADFDAPNVYCAFCDDFKASHDAVEYLIKGGAKRILHLHDSNSFSGKRKLSGYQSALLENNMEVDKDLIALYEGNRESAMEIAEFLMALNDEGIYFDAVFAGSDYLATGALSYARRKRLSVPNQLAIIGYNNTVLTTCCYPELTSVDNRIEQLSSQVVKTLIELLTGSDMPQKTVISGELVKRASTK